MPLADHPLIRRPFPLVDLLFTTGLFVLASFLLGALWSLLRVGVVSPVFVREAQFGLGMLLLIWWVLRNRKGHRPGTTRNRGPVPLPRPRTRATWYHRLTGNPPSADRVFALDYSLFAAGILILILSLGPELLA